MHSPLLFRLFVVLLLGVTTAYVLPEPNPLPRDITKATKLDSDIIKARPASVPVYQCSPDISSQLARKQKREEQDSQESPFHVVPMAEGPKVTARDSTEEGHPRLYKRDGGMTAIYAIVPVLVVGFLIGGVIIWRKAHGL
ncbi:hypothetical protein B0T20DRAFT_502162 [Sordaria brevicollis]|uniref:Uncharacterized protein n=1 Tax=Sordaria brevicollis TaxID=83679 RepID=A0AAE0PB02_SORBR|nr:hypothetical protein B0T20DRAFT_502162 [Sordaria brevicollis]